jgi:UDP-N-acetylmuramoylalanine--D-glutamate ligase
VNTLENQKTLVVGLGGRGRAACVLLRRGGAAVHALDTADTVELRGEAGRLRELGVEVKLGATKLPVQAFDFAVVSPAVPQDNALLSELKQRKIPLVGELELGFQQAKCLSIAIAGTNGKGTTAELIQRMLTYEHRKTLVCGHQARPVCDAVEESRELDYLILQVNSFQLETTQFFRPAVAVLMNLAPDHLDRYAGMADYIKANAKLFANQQPFDWAIIQSEALAQLQSLNLPMPGKVVTFSAQDRNA